jgi:hypothetical protein
VVPVPGEVPVAAVTDEGLGNTAGEDLEVRS